MIFQGGLYMFTLWDYYSATGLALFWFCFWEGVGFAWGYGAEHIYEHVEDMLGHKINPWLKICWKYVSPFVIMVSSHHSKISIFTPNFFTDSLYLLRMHLQCTQIGALRVPTLGPLDGHVYGHSLNRLGSFVFLVLDHRCARNKNFGKVCLC